MLGKRDGANRTPLLTACCFDNATLVEFFLTKGAAVVEVFDQKGRTALYLAAKHGQLGVVKV